MSLTSRQLSLEMTEVQGGAECPPEPGPKALQVPRSGEATALPLMCHQSKPGTPESIPQEAKQLCPQTQAGTSTFSDHISSWRFHKFPACLVV